MAKTVVVTRDVEDRYRGFLLSVMLEVAPGVYVNPSMSKGARERVWEVMSDWFASLARGSLTLIYPDKNSPSGLFIDSLGTPRKDVVDFDGFLAVRIHEGPSSLTS